MGTHLSPEMSVLLRGRAPGSHLIQSLKKFQGLHLFEGLSGLDDLQLMPLN